MTRTTAYLSLLLLLCACHVSAPAPQAMHVLDFGAIEPTDSIGLPQIDLDVSGTAALRTRQILYRRAASSEVSAYAYHQWAAAPAALLEQRLKQVMDADPWPPGFRVALELLTLEQQLSPGSGDVRLTIHAILSETTIACAQRTFDIRAPTATADANGAALAVSKATLTLAAALSRWLDSSRTMCPTHRGSPEAIDAR